MNFIMNNKDIEEMKKLVLMVLEENRILREMLAKEWRRRAAMPPWNLSREESE